MPHVFSAPLIYFNRFYTGLVSQRIATQTPLRVFGRRLIELYDSMIDGLNVELTPKLTVRRRPGFSQYNSNIVAGTQQNYYSFKSTNGTIYPIVDTTTNTYSVQPGSVAVTSILSKGADNTNESSFKSIGNQVYIANKGFNIGQKWDGTTKTNWGIAIASVNGSVGPNAAGTGADGGEGFANTWTNPGNITAQDGSFAVLNYTIPSSGNSLRATNFGFAIPATSTIQGIQVEIKGLSSAGSSTSAGLIKGGNLLSTTHTYNAPASNSFITLGGASDLWGGSWTPNDINQTNFGFYLAPELQFGGSGTFNLQIDFIRITVFALGGPSVSVNAGAGSFSATAGYQYVFCYGNSNTGHVSSPTPPSASTGVFTNKLNVQVSLTASTDAQVNQIRVFRTTDGGAGIYFELPTSPYPNTTANITDNAADTTLSLLTAPLPLTNNPPPTGMVSPEFHMGRMWGATQNLIYYAGGPDTYIGVPEEAWPPANVFKVPLTVQRLVSSPMGLLAFTADSIYIVRGIDTLSFTIQEWIKGVGCRSYNAVAVDGSTIYFFSTDKQLLRLDSSGIFEVGHQIGDLLQAIDPSAVYVTAHHAGSRDNKLFVSDGSTNLFSFDLKHQAWNSKAQPVGGVNAIGSIETAPGTYTMLLGLPAAGNTIRQRDLTVNTDNGSSFNAFATFGSITLASPGQMAILQAALVESSSASFPSLSYLSNELSGTFTAFGTSSIPDPYVLSQPASYNSQLFYIHQQASGGVASSPLVKHIQLQVGFGSANTADELFGLGIFGSQQPVQGQPQIPALQGI